ncbi:MAG: nucleotidyltransferase family protein [Pirellulales bacterium]|nr:nucleotidyltransferase family protein [Pirellulales bacterium]
MTPDRNRIIEALREATPELLSKYGVTRIGVFGSVARNQGTQASDVDIVYEMKHPNLFTVVHLKADLERILHYPVDLVRMGKRLPPLMKKRIEQEAIYV